MFKVFHGCVPNVFGNFFSYHYTIHEHHTGSAQHLHITSLLTNVKSNDKDVNHVIYIMYIYIYWNNTSGPCINTLTFLAPRIRLAHWSHLFSHIHECSRWCLQWKSLLWRHNGRDGVSNHQPHDCLLNRLFRRRSKKISKLRVTDLCAGNSPVTGEFLAHMTSNAENFTIWWRHHVLEIINSVMAELQCTNIYLCGLNTTCALHCLHRSLNYHILVVMQICGP